MSALQTEDAPSEPLVERRRGCVKLPAAVASVVVLAGLVLVAVEELGHPAAPATTVTTTIAQSTTSYVPSADYQCTTDLDLGDVVKPSQKGMAVDDTTFLGCSDRIPKQWPNTKEPMGSLRLFKAWDPSWSEEQRPRAWAGLKAAVVHNKLKVLVGTQISCNETDDDKDWSLVKQLLQLLGPEHVMGLAVGNELELLQFKPTEMVPRGCPERIWKGGYFYKKLLHRVSELDDMGFDDLPLTSVFGGYILGDTPFVDIPKAQVLSFFTNVTIRYGSRWVFTLNIYPYFDPNNKLDVNSTSKCEKALNMSLCLEPRCLLPKITATMRRSMQKLTGGIYSRLWLGETGWSSPQASTLPGANPPMAKCKEFSSEESFRTYYKNFLAWDLNIGEELGPDHVFYFTLRDAVNFGVGEHFGLIKGCKDMECKLQSPVTLV